MSIRKAAMPCGIAGGIWGILAPLLVFVPTIGYAPVDLSTGESKRSSTVSMIEAGMVGEFLPILGFIALMGMLGLLAIALHKKRPRLGRIFIWVSALAMLIVSLGLIYFLPAAILLIVALVGLKEVEKSQSRA